MDLADVVVAAKQIGATATAAVAGWGALKFFRRKVEARRKLQSDREHSFATIKELAHEIIPKGGTPLRQVINLTNNNVREVRESLHHMQHQLRISSEMMDFAFMRADPDGDVTDIDRVMLHITGRSPEELMGRNWYTSIVQSDRARVVDAIANSVRNQTEVRIEFSLECLRGMQTLVRMYSRPRYASSGELLEFTMGVQVVQPRVGFGR